MLFPFVYLALDETNPPTSNSACMGAGNTTVWHEDNRWCNLTPSESKKLTSCEGVNTRPGPPTTAPPAAATPTSGVAAAAAAPSPPPAPADDDEPLPPLPLPRPPPPPLLRCHPTTGSEAAPPAGWPDRARARSRSRSQAAHLSASARFASVHAGHIHDWAAGLAAVDLFGARAFVFFFFLEGDFVEAEEAAAVAAAAAVEDEERRLEGVRVLGLAFFLFLEAEEGVEDEDAAAAAAVVVEAAAPAALLVEEDEERAEEAGALGLVLAFSKTVFKTSRSTTRTKSIPKSAPRNFEPARSARLVRARSCERTRGRG